MRTKTSLAQRLPADMEDKVVEFHRFVLRSRQRWGYDLSRILNMDETQMRFELPATRTLEFTGSRTVPVLSCGADKQSFTVALTVKANGKKLPPKVIFKGVQQLNINTPPRMQISVHKKGWMDEEGMFYLHTVCSENKTRFSEFETRFERLYCCYGYHVTEHVLLSTYTNFSWSFFLKSFSEGF